MVDPSVLPGFLTAVVLVTLAPGPDNAYIAAVAVRRGMRAGALSAGGMALGMVVHVTAAAFGLAVVLRSTPAALNVVRVGGAVYLGWLAFTELRSARAVRIGTATAAADHYFAPDGRLLGRAVLTNLTNPKVVLFFASFLPQFVRPGYGPTSVQLLCLGAMFLLVGLIIDTAVGLCAGKLGGAVSAGGRTASVLSVIAGLTFGVLAAVLVVETVSG
jgi:threonine/homoserine/homoserine lactone efflux protein